MKQRKPLAMLGLSRVYRGKARQNLFDKLSRAIGKRPRKEHFEFSSFAEAREAAKAIVDAGLKDIRTYILWRIPS